jgi:hypothetical protein
MAQYEISASRPTPNSDFEFYTAGFEILANKPYMPELLAALAAPGQPSGPFARYVAMLRDNKRWEVIADMANAGLLTADQPTTLSVAVETLVSELAAGRLAVFNSVLEYAHISAAASYRIPAFLRVLSAAETIAASPTGAAHLLGKNSAPFTKVLTRHHVTRARTSYARALQLWLAAFHLPGVDILVATTEVDRLLLLALQKVREDAKQDHRFRRLRGRELASALDERQPLWRRTLDTANALDDSAGLPLRTVLSLVTLDLACPRPTGALAA